MGYLHIENLYKYPDIFLFKEVYCLEKLHGTSAHVGWKGGELRFFSGGERREKFEALFNNDALKQAFVNVVGADEAVVFGEAYGGKCQGMKGTYGKELKFAVFDVKIGESWLNVPNAHDVSTKLGLEFVDYKLVPATLEALTVERDRPSVQSTRNGISGDKKREGVVIRPPIELRKNNGERVICKYKTEEFQETKSTRPVDLDKLKVLEGSEAIASEWVTPMRLEHVLQKLPEVTGMEHTGTVIKAMIEDVKREASGEVVWSKDAERAIGKATAIIFKKRVMTIQK